MVVLRANSGTIGKLGSHPLETNTKIPQSTWQFLRVKGGPRWGLPLQSQRIHKV